MKNNGIQKQTSLTNPMQSTLPIHEPIAIYYRQSTTTQVGNVSTKMQTIDMIDYIKRLGWHEDNIILIDMDKGVSGTKKIDERPGMKHLFDLITQGEVKVVACQDEDRLFRDVTQIQTNVFIEACRASKVMVLTPQMLYDFSNEAMGVFHARQFRFKSEMAAEYINSYIRGRLHRAKDRLIYEGRWAGGCIPIGYMVDMRKKLPDGTPNPHWRHYVPCEPYAEVIREYFRLFLSFSGSIRGTMRHIHEHGPFFPDPVNTPIPDGFRVQTKIKYYGKGYSLGRAGIQSVVTNPVYLGHWTAKRQVIHWNHHEPLVEEAVFFKAFNYVSDTDLEGNSNTNFSPNYQHIRPSKDEKRPVARPLFAGMIVSHLEDGEVRSVGTNWVGPLQHYTYNLWGKDHESAYKWGKAAKFVDSSICTLLLDKLAATFDPEIWESSIKEFSQDYKKRKNKQQAQLNALIQVKENVLSNLETLTHPELIRSMEARYENAELEYQRLSKKLAQLDKDVQDFAYIRHLRESSNDVVAHWEYMTRDEKRVVVDAFVQKIVATHNKDHGLYLEIFWKDGTTEEVLVPRQATTGNMWSPSEMKLLVELAEQDEPDQLAIAKAFPTRKWTYIRRKYHDLTGKQFYVKPKPIYSHETYFDYLERIGESCDPNSGFEICSEIKLHDGLSSPLPAGAKRLHQLIQRS